MHARWTQREWKGGGEGKKKRKQKRQESLNSLFMCLPLHLHCTAELLPSAPGLGEAGNAKHRGVDADGKRRV